jgi:uncharacterized protein (DUF924 family)
MNQEITQILNFWFEDPQTENYGKPRAEWFTKNTDFDQLINQQFFHLYQEAKSQKLNHWQNSPQGCLALILLLDQFPRNLFRNNPQAFATDDQALTIAKYTIDQCFDQQLLPVQRWFIYLPFEHSENLEDQQYCLKLFASLKNDPHSQNVLEFAQQHFNIIAQFGRFPHRNQILGRVSTPAEIEFLKQPHSSF